MILYLLPLRVTRLDLRCDTTGQRTIPQCTLRWQSVRLVIGCATRKISKLPSPWLTSEVLAGRYKIRGRCEWADDGILDLCTVITFPCACNYCTGTDSELTRLSESFSVGSLSNSGPDTSTTERSQLSPQTFPESSSPFHPGLTQDPVQPLWHLVRRCMSLSQEL